GAGGEVVRGTHPEAVSGDGGLPGHVAAAEAGQRLRAQGRHQLRPDLAAAAVAGLEGQVDGLALGQRQEVLDAEPEEVPEGGGIAPEPDVVALVDDPAEE